MEKDIEDALNSNVKKFYAYRMVSRFYLYLPILVVIFLKQGLNYFEVGFLLAVYGSIICLLSIHSGIVADRFGSKVSMKAGELSKAIGLVILWIGSDFPTLIVGQIFCGLGYVMASGADSALLYNTFVQLKREGDYKEHEAKSHGYIFLSILVSGVLGGILATSSLKLPLLLTAPFHIVALLIVCTFVEPERVKTGSFQHVKISDAMNTLRSNPQVTFYVICYAAIRALILATFVGFMPLYFFIEMSINIALFGVILGSFTLTSYLIGKNTQKITNRLGEKGSIMAMVVTLFSALVILGYYRNQIGLLSPILIGVSAGLIRPLAFGKINELVDSTMRATILSSAEFVYGIFNVSLLLLISFIFHIKGLDAGFIALVIVSTIMFTALLLFAGFTFKCIEGGNTKT